MKHFLKQVIVILLTVLLVSLMTKGINYHQNPATLFVASSILALLNSLLKPMISVLTLPLNVITLGLFGWFINVFILYLATLIVPQFDIVSFSLNFGSVTFTFSTLAAYLVLALILNIVSRFINSLLN